MTGKPPSLQKLKWQARRDSNPQHPDLESGALPLELLAYPDSVRYLVSLCNVCDLQNLQYFLNSSFCGVDRLFFVVV